MNWPVMIAIGVPWLLMGMGVLESNLQSAKVRRRPARGMARDVMM